MKIPDTSLSNKKLYFEGDINQLPDTLKDALKNRASLLNGDTTKVDLMPILANEFKHTFKSDLHWEYVLKTLSFLNLDIVSRNK